MRSARVRLETVEGHQFGYRAVDTLPRIGETLILTEGAFRVVDVVHDCRGLYNSASVTIRVSWKQGAS